jgi:hypothetical protein
MKRVLETISALAVSIIFAPWAEAINVTLAEVQNGVAVVQGNKAAKNVAITWEDNVVTQSTKGGSFGFSGVVPADCIGALSDGISTTAVTLANCTPVAVAPAPVPKSGQTTSYAAGDDGALEKGVAWPIPRFTDNQNGTITDNLTGLVWLKNADCTGGGMAWQRALEFVATIASGLCALTDGSVAGEWRMPNRNELASLLDHGRSSPPALPAGHPFTNVHVGLYWTSSSFVMNSDLQVWIVDVASGALNVGDKRHALNFTAVRGGS